jgi:hypothetical protein
MKFWLAFITLLFAAAILQAQVPYGGMSLQSYYPGAVTQPYIPQAYYPQPYFVQNPYAPNPLSVAETTAEIDALSRQVDQLNDQLTRLQVQLESAQQPPAPAPAPVETSAPQPEAPSTPVALIFRNGTRIEAQGYAVAGQTLWIFNGTGSERVALSQLDVAATRTENLKRGIHFSS